MVILLVCKCSVLYSDISCGGFWGHKSILEYEQERRERGPSRLVKQEGHEQCGLIFRCALVSSCMRGFCCSFRSTLPVF